MHVSLCINYSHSLNEIFSPGLTRLHPRSKDRLTSGMKTLFWVAGQGSSRDSQNIQVIVLALDYPSEVEGKSLWLKALCTSDTGPRGPWTVMDLNPSSLSPSFHAKNAPCKPSKDGSNQQSYPAMMVRNHNNNQHGKRPPPAQYWHTCLCGNQPQWAYTSAFVVGCFVLCLLCCCSLNFSSSDLYKQKPEI